MDPFTHSTAPASRCPEDQIGLGCANRAPDEARCASCPIFPELTSAPVSCGSWVIRDTKGRLVETYDRETAHAAFRRGLSVRTAYDHLASLADRFDYRDGTFDPDNLNR